MNLFRVGKLISSPLFRTFPMSASLFGKARKHGDRNVQQKILCNRFVHFTFRLNPVLNRPKVYTVVKLLGFSQFRFGWDDVRKRWPFTATSPLTYGVPVNRLAAPWF